MSRKYINNIFKKIYDLDSDLREEYVFNNKEKFLKTITKEDYPYLICPGENPSSVISAYFIKLFGFPKLNSYMLKILEFLQDANWQSSDYVIEVLKTADKNLLAENIHKALIVANQEDDDMWIEFLINLKANLNME